MKPISQNLSNIKNRYDVVVVGSGYGGGVSASRMARAGKKVCLLERGKEILPGKYPNDLFSIKDEIQIDAPHGHIGSKTALFDFRTNNDMNVLMGCGLGGTSLINANVALELDPCVFKSEHWPQPEEGKDWSETLKPYYEIGRTMLDSRSYPKNFPSLNKLNALEKSASVMQQNFYRPPINVNFKDRVNPFGVHQKACNGCGDCCSGCNVSAKNTTLMNYLPDAHNHGAEIFTEASVQYISKDNQGWSVHITDNASAEETVLQILCEVLILSAGSLGSTEILLRSREKGLALSQMLGKHFSGNGDVLAFGYNSYWDEKEKNETVTSSQINGVGVGDNLIPKKNYPGPCITGIIDMRKTEDVKDGLVIEEGVIPGALATGLAAGFLFGDTQYGNFFQYGKNDGAARLMDAKKLADGMQDPNSSMTDFAYKGAVAKTQTYLIMSHDDAKGVLKLEDNRIRINWPDIGKSDPIKRDNEKIKEANQAIKGQYLPNPAWTDEMGRQLITVHPVGGSRMGKDASSGVVDSKCRVFNNEGNAVHEGLYVMDGAVFPGAAGVNPLLTITALAERACYLLSKEKGWKIDYQINGHDISPIAEIKKEPTREQQELVYDKASKLIGFLPQLWDKIVEFFQRIWKWIKHQLFLVINKIVLFFVSKYPSKLSPGLSFKETMAGYLTTNFIANKNPLDEHISDSYEIAFKQGQGEGNKGEEGKIIDPANQPSSDRSIIADNKAYSISYMIVHLFIDSDNIYNTVVIDKEKEKKSGEINQHEAKVSGQVIHGELSKKPMEAAGKFYLFPIDQDKVESWNMVYDMNMTSVEGKQYHFLGKKILHKTDSSHWWNDVTTLYVDVYEIKNGAESPVGKGIIKLTLADLMKQGTTVEIKQNDFVKRLPKFIALLLEEIYAQKFGAFFGMTLFTSYGGMLTDLANFPADYDSYRYRRPIRAPKPEVYNVKTKDGFNIKLTRYAGGTKGPILMAPGFTVNACSFAADTVDENLVEHLCNLSPGNFGSEENYDVWLFDYRASPDAGNGGKPFTIDDIAEHDWPAAVDFVINKTKSKDVQAIVHCVGSMSLLMAKIKGLKGVRSLISSQLTLHPVTNWLNYLKADLHMVKILEDAHQISTIDIRSSDSTTDKGIDAMLWQLPVPEGEECTNPCCRRIFAVYGPSYTHKQLNHYTHIAMREWFGVISTKAFDQLTTILRLGYTVDHEGKNTYLPHVKKIDIPIHFIAGDQNQEFLPETSLRTYQWLRANCNPDLFSREVFKDYAHMDFFIGKNASKDIFPKLVVALQMLDEKTGH